ncbi:MAG: ABC transporter permease [Mobilitalea sp.]
MRAYLAFTKKEFCESLRTYKIVIMAAVFLLLGVMNPATAKLTPLLLEKFMPEGIKITLGAPTALDSWAQFYKNVPQMGLIVLVILYSGIISNEFLHGTLINMLTKGLSRSIVIISKFTMAVLTWSASYALCFVVTYGYTAYFWSGEGIHHIIFAAICLWIFGIVLLSVIIFSGVLYKNSYGCLLFTGGFVMFLLLINIIPKAKEYNPISLVSNNMALLSGDRLVSDFTFPIIISVIIILGMVALAIPIFNKKQL